MINFNRCLFSLIYSLFNLPTICRHSDYFHLFIYLSVCLSIYLSTYHFSNNVAMTTHILFCGLVWLFPWVAFPEAELLDQRVCTSLTFGRYCQIAFQNFIPIIQGLSISLSFQPLAITILPSPWIILFWVFQIHGILQNVTFNSWVIFYCIYKSHFVIQYSLMDIWVGSYGNCIFTFLRNCQACFPQ